MHGARAPHVDLGLTCSGWRPMREYSSRPSICRSSFCVLARITLKITAAVVVEAGAAILLEHLRETRRPRAAASADRARCRRRSCPASGLAPLRELALERFDPAIRLVQRIGHPLVLAHVAEVDAERAQLAVEVRALHADALGELAHLAVAQQQLLRR